LITDWRVKTSDRVGRVTGGFGDFGVKESEKAFEESELAEEGGRRRGEVSLTADWWRELLVRLSR
jgi:hypothetical protein